MTLLVVIAAGVAALVWLFWPSPFVAVSGPPPARVRLVPVATGFHLPVYVTAMPGAPDTLLVLEQDGAIYEVRGGRRLATPFLDLRSKVERDYIERGLYTIAFDAHFSDDRRFYVAYTAKPSGDPTVSWFEVPRDRPQRADPTEHVLLQVPTATRGHVGLQLQVGPDGMLYISIGDLSLERRTLAPMRLGNLQGKILRIRVNPQGTYDIPSDNPFVGRRGARPEIWAYGFRNPFRFSFDRATGDLWVGDVGWGTEEEIDKVVKGGDYGWPMVEGRVKHFRIMAQNVVLDGRILGVAQILLGQIFRPSTRVIPPVVAYEHTELDPLGGDTVVGGYVYRGDAIPALRGYYLYGDWSSGRIWALTQNGGHPVVSLLQDTGLQITSFGEDEHGELYVTAYKKGEVFKIEPAPAGSASAR